MKELKEILLILTILYFGEFLSEVLHLTIPGSVVGMVLLLFLFLKKIVKEEDIEWFSKLILNNLSFFFIPVGVKLMEKNSLNLLIMLKMIFISVVTTVLVMVITGKTIETLIKRRKNDRKF